MTVTRLNPDVSGIIVAVNYTESKATTAGTRNYTHAIPSGYKLLVERPVGAFVSGDVTASLTDRFAFVNGSNVRCQFYVVNPNAKNVEVRYTLIFIKSEFA